MMQSIIKSLFTPTAGMILPLNGLRGLGILVVMFGHYLVVLAGKGLLPLEYVYVVKTLWVIVDLFFVLSGFLIGSILFREYQQSGRIDFKAFYVRRMFRIFPAYYFILALSFLVFTRFEFFQNYYLAAGADTFHSLWSFLLYVSNYMFNFESTYLIVGWSLCIEEHFYLVVPLLLSLVLKRSVGHGLWIFFVLCFFSLGLRMLLVDTYEGQSVALLPVYYRTHFRTDSLLVGTLLAYLSVYYESQVKAFFNRFAQLILLVIVALLVLIFRWDSYVEKQGMYYHFLFLLVAIAWGLLVGRLVHCQGKLHRFFSLNVLYPLSQASYGMYLWHMFMLSPVCYAYTAIGLDQLPLALGVTLGFVMFVLLVYVICAAQLLLFEDRFRVMGAKYSRRRQTTSE